MAIAAIILLILVGVVIYIIPSKEQLAMTILAMEALVYRDATIAEFEILKNGTKEEQGAMAKSILERLQKSGKLP